MSDCCSVPMAKDRGSNQCPVCHTKGKPVDLLTVRSLVKAEKKSEIPSVSHFFCTTPTCDAVYFSNDTKTLFRKEDVAVRVGLKETSDPIPVCYCFGHTRGSIREEIATTGRSTVEDRVRAEIKAGRCECEVRNPSGACCLGEVRAAVKECLKEAHSFVG